MFRSSFTFAEQSISKKKGKRETNEEKSPELTCITRDKKRACYWSNVVAFTRLSSIIAKRHFFYTIKITLHGLFVGRRETCIHLYFPFLQSLSFYSHKTFFSLKNFLDDLVYHEKIRKPALLRIGTD
jgi:hypothetical protein